VFANDGALTCFPAGRPENTILFKMNSSGNAAGSSQALYCWRNRIGPMKSARKISDAPF
jgi:hypothetical protein